MNISTGRFNKKVFSRPAILAVKVREEKTTGPSGLVAIFLSQLKLLSPGY